MVRKTRISYLIKRLKYERWTKVLLHIKDYGTIIFTIPYLNTMKVMTNDNIEKITLSIYDHIIDMREIKGLSFNTYEIELKDDPKEILSKLFENILIESCYFYERPKKFVILARFLKDPKTLLDMIKERIMEVVGVDIIKKLLDMGYQISKISKSIDTFNAELKDKHNSVTINITAGDEVKIDVDIWYRQGDTKMHIHIWKVLKNREDAEEFLNTVFEHIDNMVKIIQHHVV